MYHVVLFDLDGTLTDPGEGITNSVAYALKKYGIGVSDKRELYKFIGPPLHESFEMYYNFSKEQAKEAVEYYREYYRETGIFENVVYQGMEDTLKILKDSGRKLAVATSKPELFAKEILEHFHLETYFEYVAGANMDGTRTKKDEVISYALDALKLSGAYLDGAKAEEDGVVSYAKGAPELSGTGDSPRKELGSSKVLMVGDREHDILGAAKVGLSSIGVLYGYGSREELTAAGALYLARKPEDIWKYISAGNGPS